MLYITVISFAVIRVISAVFLKDTLDAAQNDAENLVVERCFAGRVIACTKRSVQVLRPRAMHETTHKQMECKLEVRVIEHVHFVRLRKKDEYVMKLEAVFKAIDAAGDGMITEDRRPPRQETFNDSM